MIKDNINGKTSIFGVIGDPIEHTFSPVIQNTFAQKLGRNMVYGAFHTSTAGLEKAVKGAYELNIQGLNVTVPHKREVMKYLCDVDRQAEQIGAVNTLKYTENGYVGFNTDITGIYYTLKEAGESLKDKNVLLLGAGGAAYAAGVLAVSEGCRELIIANRTLENAEKLKNHIEKYYSSRIAAIPLSEINKTDICHIVINTTTVGFGDKIGLSPVNEKGFFEKKGVRLAFDAIYAPWQTKFLKDAQEAGVKAVNGFSMLVYQAAAAQEIWFGNEIPACTKKQVKDEIAEYYRRD